MAKKRTAPNFNLTPELTQVLSSDFNLFYTPEPTQQDPAVKNFTKSLDAFVRGGLSDIGIMQEVKKKNVNEAKAIKDYETNRDNFRKKVEEGEIPKEANPYYIEKAQELYLNSKAQEFKQKVFQEYARKQVADNNTIGSFDVFYKNELKNFINENQLGVYDPVKLNKGFFSKTSGTKNDLGQAHAQTQLAKVGAEFELRFKENLQLIFTSDKPIEEKGAEISAFILDAVKNGSGKLTTRQLLLDSLKEYATTTSDFEGASRLVRELPKNIKIGTDVLFNVKALENDFNAIKDAVDERQDKRETVQNSRAKQKVYRESNIAYDSLDTFDNIEDFRKSDIYKKLSATGKKNAEKIYANHFSGYAEKTNGETKTELLDIIKRNEYLKAQEYLIDNQQQFTEKEFVKFRNVIGINEATKKDGLLEHRLFKAYESDLSNRIQTTSKTIGVSTVLNQGLVTQFEEDAKQWLADNPIGGDKFKTFEARQTAFIKYVSERREDYLKYIQTNSFKTTVPTKAELEQKASEGGTTETSDKTTKSSSKTEKFDPDKLPKKKLSRKERRDTPREDPELSINLKDAVIIPSNLKGREKSKFIRNNKNALSQEDFDRISKKQEENKEDNE